MAKIGWLTLAIVLIAAMTTSAAMLHAETATGVGSGEATAEMGDANPAVKVETSDESYSTTTSDGYFESDLLRTATIESAAGNYAAINLSGGTLLTTNESTVNLTTNYMGVTSTRAGEINTRAPKHGVPEAASRTNEAADTSNSAGTGSDQADAVCGISADSGNVFFFGITSTAPFT